MSQTRNRDELIQRLNGALAAEYASIIQLLTHASMVEGPNAPVIREVLHEMASKELDHAKALLQRIWALDGKPTIAPGKITIAEVSELVLDVELEKEREAVEMYYALLHSLDKSDVALYETVETLLEESIEDLETLRRLKGRGKG